VDMVIFRSEMKLPQFFVLFVDHKLRIGDEAESDGCSLRALDGPFLSHEHDASIFPHNSFEVDGEDLIEVYGRLQGP